MPRLLAALILLLASPQDVNTGKILEKADALLEEAKAAYEKARSTSSVPAFVEAGFKLEEARIKYLVLQEIGDAERQKLAGDRLRAVNQLNKLINDGKVAVMNPPAPKPATPANPEFPPASAVPAPAPVDVSKRAPVPDAAKQKEVEKLARDLFKSDYAKKGAADQRSLAKKLLEEARKSQDDPTSVWVLCREAEDIAAQSGDVHTTLLAVGRRAELFDVDPLHLRAAALASVAKNVKAPEDAAALAEAHLKHVDELVGADQYDAADKAAAAAVAQAKKAGDSELSALAATRAKQVAEMKSLFLAQKSVLEKLARDGDDPGANLEMGKYLCFVKGSWDLGLRFMVKGADPTLRILAQKELAFPQNAAEQAVIADGWYELGEKDKSPLRKGQLIDHARSLYEAALKDATGLVRAKIEKRLLELKSAAGSGPTPEVDLLSLIDIGQDVVSGEWKREGKVLATPQEKWARIQLPYIPPEEYDLVIDLVKTQGNLAIAIGLIMKGRQFIVALDAYGGVISGLELLDGRGAKDNETVYRGQVLPSGKPQVITCVVRANSLTVMVGPKKIIDWKGDAGRLGLYDGWRMQRTDTLFLGAYDTRFAIRGVKLRGTADRGTKLR